jgi:serine/threonine protein kinase
MITEAEPSLAAIARGVRGLRGFILYRKVESIQTMPLAIGDKLGPYEILARIGAGGMGEVYKARDTRLGRIVAVKVSQEEFSERFEREARAVAALNHPKYLSAPRCRSELPGDGICRWLARGANG